MRHAPYQPTTDAERIALDVAGQIVMRHEPRPMGCACGDQLGDSIDYRWHLANQTALAVTDALPQAPPRCGGPHPDQPGRSCALPPDHRLPHSDGDSYWSK